MKYHIRTVEERNALFDELGLQRLKDSYMRGDEVSPQERFAYVSSAFASNEAHAQRLYDHSSKHWLSYSTPILSFGKNKRGQPISCFLNYLSDTSEGLVNNLSETNWLSMMGGGVGIHVGIRGSDSKSTGVMPHLKTYDASSLAYRQDTRRGSYAAYLDISHPDVLMFLEMRKATGDQNQKTLNLHHGINIPDKFMEIVERAMVDPDVDDSWDLIQPHNGQVVETVSAKELWMRILELRAQTGEPYIWFIDEANRGVPEFQKKAGLKNHGSNLCVAPETLILTRSGYQPIGELAGEQIDIWNGAQWSNVLIKQTGANQKLVKVVTNSGFELGCTEYHKFYVAIRDQKLDTTIHERRAHELKPGDKLIKCDFPVIEGSEVLNHAYANGFFSADGNVYHGKSRIYFYHGKRDLAKHCGDIFEDWRVDENQNREYGHTKVLKDKFFVPIGNYTIASKMEWLAGFADGDGTVARNGKTQSIQLGSTNRPFLLEIQMMLQTLGINSKVTQMNHAGVRAMPANDGTGGTKDYFCQDSYRLLITQTGICKLRELGFSPKRLVLTDHVPNRECSQFVQVKEVIDEGRFDDTYCFDEPRLHMGVFNGILTGQCSEISLVTNAERTAVCCLSSVNLEYYDEWKDHPTFLRDVHEMLDNVIQHFIDNAPDTIKRARFSAMRERSIGIGALGFHAYLQKNMVPFESVTAKVINNQIFASIRAALNQSNFDLAQERGACPDAADYGVMVRNAHVMSIAPNASSSIIMGNTSPSIEPYAANAYRQDTTSGAYLNKNRFLDAILKRLSIGKEESWYDDTWASIISSDGSAQHLDCLTDDQKEVFKTAMEIDQRWVIEHSADRQVHVDQAISTNVFFRATANIKYIHAVHFLAWKKKLKSMYYYRSEKLRKADQVGQRVERKKIEDEINMQELAAGNDCIACEG